MAPARPRGVTASSAVIPPSPKTARLSQVYHIMQALCGRLDLIRTYDERKLSFWSSVNGLDIVVLQACYDSLVGQRSLLS